MLTFGFISFVLPGCEGYDSRPTDTTKSTIANTWVNADSSDTLVIGSDSSVSDDMCAMQGQFNFVGAYDKCPPKDTTCGYATLTVTQVTPASSGASCPSLGKSTCLYYRFTTEDGQNGLKLSCGGVTDGYVFNGTSGN